MKLVLKTLSLVFLFIIPTGIWIYFFKEEPQTQEVIKQSFGFVPTIAVTVVGFVLALFVHSIVKTNIQQDKTGTIAIMFYGIVLLVLMTIGNMVLSTILTTAQSNYTAFETTFTLYINVTKANMASMGIGLILNGIALYLQFKK